MVQLEHWGCPWSRKADGHANVRAFGGMKIERTWFAADKTGFHMLHTLFQTSIKYPSIQRFDEHFCVDLMVDDGRVQGVVAIEIATGEFRLIQAKSVIIATGGAGRVFRENTNGGIVTGDGMALAYRHGVPLRDMEFVQYHPTCMPGTGLLFTEALPRRRRLPAQQGRLPLPAGLRPRPGRRRRRATRRWSSARATGCSQAFWHEKQKGRTIARPARRRGAPRPAPPGRKEAARAPAADLRAGRRIPRRRSGARQPIPVLPGGALHHGRHHRRRLHRHRRCRACTRPANAPASASTAPTGWARIR